MYSYHLMVKSMSCCCVRGWQLFSNPITYALQYLGFLANKYDVSRGGSKLLKRGGTTRPVIIVNVRLASTRGSGACPPGNFENLHLLDLRLNLRAILVIYQPLIQCSCRHRYRKLLICMPIHAGYNITQITIFYNSYASTS